MIDKLERGRLGYRMRIGVTLLSLVAGLLVAMLLSASSDPVVRHFQYRPAGHDGMPRPIRVVLMTDTHVSGPDMPPARLARIVAKINSLHPDLVLLGGDFVSAEKFTTKRYDAATAIRPLAALNARLGVVAVLGNHDHWSDATAVRNALRDAGVEVLNNSVVEKGPLLVGGVDDDFTHHADPAAVASMMRGTRLIPVLLSHSPDVFPETPQTIGLILAGHTHCGQVSLPFVGPVFTASRYEKRFACGVIGDGPKRMIVSAGVGTSILPLRLNAPPDIWLVQIGP